MTRTVFFSSIFLHLHLRVSLYFFGQARGRAHKNEKKNKRNKKKDFQLKLYKDVRSIIIISIYVFPKIIYSNI
jgi:hypothetical protein